MYKHFSKFKAVVGVGGVTSNAVIIKQTTNFTLIIWSSLIILKVLLERSAKSRTKPHAIAICTFTAAFRKGVASGTFQQHLLQTRWQLNVCWQSFAATDAGEGVKLAFWCGFVFQKRNYCYVTFFISNAGFLQQEIKSELAKLSTGDKSQPD